MPKVTVAEDGSVRLVEIGGNGRRRTYRKYSSSD
jgi:hypothetical protein